MFLRTGGRSDFGFVSWLAVAIVKDCRLYILVGYRVANATEMPEWKPGAEFKAKREASLRQAGSASQ